MTHDPRPREDDVDNYMRELEALGFSDRVARSRDEAMVWQWQDEIRDQPTHEQLLKLLARVREDERHKRETHGPYFNSVVHECCERVQTERSAALRDAVKAVKSLTHGGGNPNAVYRLPGIISAIEALAERERNDWQNGSVVADSLT